MPVGPLPPITGPITLPGVGDDDPDNGVPGWAGALTGASATALGVALTDNPVKFVQAVVIDRLIIGSIIGLTQAVVGLILTAWSQMIGALGDGGTAVVAGTRAVFRPLTFVLVEIGNLAAEGAGAFGPAAPLITVGTFIVVGLALSFVVEAVIGWVRRRVA